MIKTSSPEKEPDARFSQNQIEAIYNRLASKYDVWAYFWNLVQGKEPWNLPIFRMVKTSWKWQLERAWRSMTL